MITFCNCLSVKEISSLGFLHGSKRSCFAKENEMASMWGNLLFTTLYLWSAELTQPFIEYESSRLGCAQGTLDKQCSGAAHKEKLRQ